MLSLGLAVLACLSAATAHQARGRVRLWGIRATSAKPSTLDVMQDFFTDEGKPPLPPLEWRTVFWIGEEDDDYCYRIPTIIRTSSGVLLAFAERRYPGCGDNNHHDLVMKKSHDAGNSWGPIISVVLGHGEAISNANPVEVDMGSGKKAILLLYDTLNNPTTELHGRNMQVWSFDEGSTWHDAKDITLSLPTAMQGCMPGPSVGVQGPDGTIYFSCHGPGNRAVLHFSQDLGETWKSSKVAEDVDECSAAILQNSSVAFNCKGNNNLRRLVIWSATGQMLMPPTDTRGSIDPYCQGSMIRFGNTLFMSNDANLTTRTNLTLKYSHDSGMTWHTGQSLHMGPSAYSQLVAFPEGADMSCCRVPKFTMGVLAEIGNAWQYERIAFMRTPSDLSGSAPEI